MKALDGQLLLKIVDLNIAIRDNNMEVIPELVTFLNENYNQEQQSLSGIDIQESLSLTGLQDNYLTSDGFQYVVNNLTCYPGIANIQIKTQILVMIHKYLVLKTLTRSEFQKQLISILDENNSNLTVNAYNILLRAAYIIQDYDLVVKIRNTIAEDVSIK